MSEATRFVKIYGLPRSGTNYLAWMLQANCENVHVLQNVLGWKHGGPPPTSVEAAWVSDAGVLPSYTWHDHPHREALREAFHRRDVAVICLFRDPAYWYASLCRYEAHRRREMPSPENAAERWRAFWRTVQQFQVKGVWPAATLKFTHLVERPEEALHTLQQGLPRHISAPSGECAVPQHRLRRSNDGWSCEDMESPEPFPGFPEPHPEDRKRMRRLVGWQQVFR